MKVGVLWQRFGPYHVARLKALARRSNMVAIEVSSQDAINQWEEIPEIEGIQRVTVFPGQNSDQLPPPLVVKRLQQTLDSLDLDVLGLPSWSTNHALGGLNWCMRRGVPAICMTDSTLVDRRRHFWKEWVKSQIVRCFTTAHVSGRACREYVASLGIPEERIFLGLDAVDNEHFARGAAAAREDAANLRRKLNLPERYWVTVSRLIPTKNIESMLRAVRQFRIERPNEDIHLVLVGGGPCETSLRSLVAELGLERVVHFVGNQSYDQVPAYLGLAEAFILASLSETWGLVVNEAMAAGLPVIVSERCGCAPDLVHEGVTGYLFDPLVPPSLAARLVQLSDFPERRAAMGAAATREIAAWSLDHNAENFLNSARCAAAVGPPKSSWLSRRCVSALMHRSNPNDNFPIEIDVRARRPTS